MSYYRDLAGDTVFRCNVCGRRKRVKYVPTSNLCQKCAAKNRGQQPNPTEILVTDLVVTRRVRKRFEKQADKEIPRNRALVIGELIDRWCVLIFWLSAYPLARALFHEFSPTLWIFVFLWCFGLPLAIMNATERVLATPSRERRQRVTARVQELARVRQATMQERERFYGSPEWLALRETVIKDEGRVCSQCHRTIRHDYDVTVDHKLPRTKYPELALRRDNLQILCRRCNSRKGDRE